LDTRLNTHWNALYFGNVDAFRNLHAISFDNGVAFKIRHAYSFGNAFRNLHAHFHCDAHAH
jgi:hypothetical protein